MIDFRSDTVTRPTPAMREAMMKAELGDDVLGDDPTVQRLEARVAEIVGKETALFVPSGTMSNQIGLMLHCRPGDEVYVGHHAHLGFYESGAAGALAGVQLVEVAGPGTYTADALRDSIRPKAFHMPQPRLVCLENTHNDSGGQIFAQPEVVQIAELARTRDLAVHLDGARIWNAAAATNMSERGLAEPADTVSVCFSKGLGAPVGSALCMPNSLRYRALHLRRRLGGAMRQAGLLAAAALHALEHHRGELAQDHRRSQRLAEGAGGGRPQRGATAQQYHRVRCGGRSGLRCQGERSGRCHARTQRHACARGHASRRGR